MKYEFTQKTRMLFDRGGWMVDHEDGRNDANCLHHIFGRVSNSPYNACPLNNARTHQPDGIGRKHLPAITSKEVQQKYLKKTKEYLASIGYIPSQEDLKFLKQYEQPIKM